MRNFGFFALFALLCTALTVACDPVKPAPGWPVYCRTTVPLPTKPVAQPQMDCDEDSDCTEPLGQGGKCDCYDISGTGRADVQGLQLCSAK